MPDTGPFMLFNSYEFIFAFLPVAVLLFYVIGRWVGHIGAIAWLIAASLFFYGWWNPAYLVLLAVSIGVNFGTGELLRRDGPRTGRRKAVLVLGIVFNLGLLGYFKYMNFFVESANAVFDASFTLERIVLPLAISFFTFQQITYLIDTWRGLAREYGFLHYALFVTFFPQLIAGPIVHHSEMMPQFMRRTMCDFRYRNLAIGLTIFTLGLFKKVVIADNVATFGTPVFSAADAGATLTLLEAWGGALAYTFQLYFDFSGYSDMAIGLARMFGIRLPLNFNSPYKAHSITEFWRRWHMTLSRFLRDYLYIPLGGNRKGPIRRYSNLMATMLLGGLWHGAGWTFVVWGGLHGLYLCINHAWQKLTGSDGRPGRGIGLWAARLVTFLAVVVGWVFFRAETFGGAVAILEGMAGLNGVVIPAGYQALLGPLASVMTSLGWRFEADPGLFQGSVQVIWIAALFFAIWFLPNTQEIMSRYRPAFERVRRPMRNVWDRALLWRPGMRSAAATATLLVVSILSLTRVSEFLYFQF